jgi:hypothetical protein
MLERLTHHDFQPYLGQIFHIHRDDAEEIEVQLTTLTELGADPPSDATRRPFSLIFRGPPDLMLPQRIYHLEHAELGHLDIFLVPIGPDQEGMQYEALFA